MPSAVLQINVIPKRMLTIAEAAHHCGRSLTRFKIECPVQPVTYPNGDKRYDVQDLDVWINSLKAGTNHDVDAILAKLGA
jgi:hypothetical protein